MKTITALTGQTVFDIAIQEMGSVEGIFEILEVNAFLRIDMAIPAGTRVLVPERIISAPVQDYYTRNNLKPASGIGEEISIIDQDMIYATQKVLYDLSGNEKAFEPVRLWNLDNGNLTIQINYEDVTEASNIIQVEQSLDGINFTPIEETIVMLDEEVNTHTYNLTGMLTNYCRIRISPDSSETGTINEIIWRQ